MSKVFDRMYEVDGVQVQGWNLVGTDAHERMNRRDQLVWLYGHNYEKLWGQEFDKAMCFVFSMNGVELTQVEKQWVEEYRKWVRSAVEARKKQAEEEKKAKAKRGDA